jgi:hypothetical protein
MGYFDDIPTKKNKTSTTTTKTSSGYFSDIPTKSTEPSTFSKVLGFGKEILMDTKKNVVDKPLTNVVQAVQIASKLPEIIKTGKATFTPMTPFKYKGQPVQPLGTRTADFGATPENFKKDLLDIGGTGLEIASFIGFGPSVKAGFAATEQLVKGVTKAGVQTLKRSAAEGAFGGFTGNVGSQLQDKAATDKAFNPMETVKATAGGAVLAPAINIFSRGLSKAFGKAEKPAAQEFDATLSSILNNGKKAPELVQQVDVGNVSRLSSFADNALEKNQNGVRDKSLQYFRDNPQEIVKLPIKVREVDGKVVIEDGRHRLQAAKEMGIKDLNIEDVTPQYSQVEGQLAPKSDIVSTFNPKISQEIEAEAVAKGFTQKFGDLPEVQRMDMRQQASDWQNLIDNDYDKAKRILLGQENAPDNLQVGIGLEAVTRKATKEGDWQILRELATNPNAAPTQASLAAQKLKAFDTNVIDSSDPIELMQSLSKAREKTVGIKNKVVKAEDVKTLKETIKQSAPKKITDWNDFINSIEC